MKVTCGRVDCRNNTGCGCSLNRIAIGKDMQCQNYPQTWGKETIGREEKSIEIMHRVKLRKDSKEDWLTVPDSTYPFTTAIHSFHTDWNKDVFQSVPMGDDK